MAVNGTQGHPVYNKPLPGIGWSNTSVFSFWDSPFSRPGGFVSKDAAARAAANWSQPEDGIVHMFHGGTTAAVVVVVVACLLFLFRLARATHRRAE